MVKALDELDNALGKATQPLKFGTLVVFTDGTDRANRVPADDMRQHVKEKPFDVFAIGLGAEIKPDQLASIGKSGTAMATDKTAIVKAFDDVGAKVDARTKSYYLLSYCSPSRAGKHEVRIEAVVKDGPNASEQIGQPEGQFDATGFAPGCDPNAPPSFDVTRGDLLAPPAAAGEGQGQEGRREEGRARDGEGVRLGDGGNADGEGIAAAPPARAAAAVGARAGVAAAGADSAPSAPGLHALTSTSTKNVHEHEERARRTSTPTRTRTCTSTAGRGRVRARERGRARRAEHVDEQGKRARNRTGRRSRSTCRRALSPTSASSATSTSGSVEATDAPAAMTPAPVSTTGAPIPATDTPVVLTPASVASTDTQVCHDSSIRHR